MNFAAILAGGKGTRMGNQDKPKQYLPLGGKPILVHTVGKFLVMPEFEKVIVLAPDAWINSTKDILRKFFGSNEKLLVMRGGSTRNETIMNAVDYIENNFEIDETTALVTHDSVRPFVTYRIIKDNIDVLRDFEACDTVIPASDTIVESVDGTVISNIPDRSIMYQGQTPQSFRVKTLRKQYDALSESEREILTDACKICVLRNTPVALVRGETFNIKITYPSDLKMAQALLGSEED